MAAPLTHGFVLGNQAATKRKWFEKWKTGRARILKTGNRGGKDRLQSIRHLLNNMLLISMF